MENPYQAPKSDVADVNRDEEYQPVRIFSTSGRIGRVRFIAYTFGLSFLCSILAGILAAAIGGAGVVVLIANWVAIIALSLMLSIQRAHDFNASGWLGLLGLIPLVNLIFWFIPGTDGPNRFGHKTPYGRRRVHHSHHLRDGNRGRSRDSRLPRLCEAGSHPEGPLKISPTDLRNPQT